MTLFKLAAASLVSTCLGASAALAADYNLRIQTHFSAESLKGQNAQAFADDVERMSGGRVDIEMFFSASLVRATETFDAAVNGVLDGDMTGGAYQTGKNPAFQFVGDILGGYDTPWQMYSWLYYGGGLEKAQELYNANGMHFVGWWIPGQESLSSTSPLASVEDFKDWKFRSPPGIETEIFAALGASPIVMDFGEVFTALETKVIDGADASNIATNSEIGLYDIAKHATYPGFHSMPADHLAINKEVWDELPDDIRAIIEVAMEKLAFRDTLSHSLEMEKAAKRLAAGDVTLYDWNAEQRAAFRKFSRGKWEAWAEKSPEANILVSSHIDFMKELGLISE
ncbi:TRAP transporter substrate-binding protein [Rhizobiales bacterium]|uniref:TRAP transporter substrate-binding protein n=1 Tax=Hongsoonwoonella zoysiae TaxID=2821844 RepID=UPI0015616414|nr:TRAP transporter substrate-binding protein [Hongsoonwoonella zoysiae]NRG19495.1 TRAP transporter substrate-binding protein [Hongsoonwoonella zoysiae]